MVAEQKRLGHEDGPDERDKKHKFGFTAEECCGDTLMTKWGEGHDGKQTLTRHPPRKEDVTANLLEVMRQPTAHRKKNF